MIFLMMPTMCIAKEEEVEPRVESDLSVYKTNYLSVYERSIRENIRGEWGDCDCLGLCYCTRLYHILEDTTENNDFYSAFLNGDYLVYPLGRVYLDSSISMKETFSYEKDNIMKNLSSFLNEKNIEIEEVFKNQKTNLYGLLQSYNNSKKREIPIIITDLWDTEGEELFKYEGNIIFCVPYASTKKEAVLHCEEVINNLLWNHHGRFLSFNSIYLIYTDEIIVKYSNVYRNGEEGCITIYVP